MEISQSQKVMNSTPTLIPNWHLPFEQNFYQNKSFKNFEIFVNSFGFMHFLTGGNELQSHFHVKNICKNYANRNQFVTGSQFQNFSKFMFSRRKP